MNRLIKSHKSLRIFLCHSSGDKPAVRELYERLCGDGFAPWLDEEDLLPGQNWEQEISKAVRNSDVIIVCLSRGSISKSGYVQKEIKFALDIADEQPEEAIFLIPLKLEECNLPDQLKRWHWVNLLEERGYERLVKALRHRARSLGIHLKGKSLRNTSTTASRKPFRLDEAVKRINEQVFKKYQSISPIATWITGSALSILLVAFAWPPPTQFLTDLVHNLIAVAATLFFVFFIGGVLLKGRLKGLLFPSIGGVVIFLLLQQFVFAPSTINLTASTSGKLNNNPKPPDRTLSEGQLAIQPIIIWYRGRYELPPEAREQLDQLPKILSENPRLRIMLEGHTDDAGPEDMNLHLSRVRAEAVARYLIDSGVEPNRISLQAYGETRPIVKDTSGEARARNRRVEVRVLSN